MANVNEMGLNRTGIDMSPVQSKEMLSEADRTPPSSSMDGMRILERRAVTISEAERLGSVPVPGTLKGAAKAGIQKIKGKRPELLIDKLGERLAFERSGTRLYDGLINKCEVRGVDRIEDALSLLKRFRDEEARHFEWVRQAMEKLGADPTAVTPDADAVSVASMGIHHVIFDPRTDVVQAVHAILIAEMADHEGWGLLIRLCEGMGLQDMAQGFRVALAEEDVHLQNIRRIHEELLLQGAGVA